MTAAEAASGWSVNQLAARAVAIREDIPVHGTVEEPGRRQLLEMLGLVDGPGGREVLPDDTRQVRVLPMGTAGAGADEPPARRAADDELERPGTSTLPEGLRILPPPTRRRPRAREPIEHGTVRGYSAHKRRNEDACDPCVDAITAYNKERNAARGTKRKEQAAAAAESRELRKRGPTPAPREHGTIRGYRQHITHGDERCRACLDAYNADRPRQLQNRVKRAESTAVQLDDWFGAAQRSRSPQVRQAAQVAVVALIHLRVAMDDLARAERAAARSQS